MVRVWCWAAGAGQGDLGRVGGQAGQDGGQVGGGVAGPGAGGDGGMEGPATRYGKLAITYRAAVVLPACISWTRSKES
jgi:hypothetical protein